MKRQKCSRAAIQTPLNKQPPIYNSVSSSHFCEVSVQTLFVFKLLQPPCSVLLVPIAACHVLATRNFLSLPLLGCEIIYKKPQRNVELLSELASVCGVFVGHTANIEKSFNPWKCHSQTVGFPCSGIVNGNVPLQ